MNRFRVALGGHNLTGDDLLFIQEELTKVLIGFAETTGQQFLIISGVVINQAGPNITWTAGYIFMAGEICEVDAGSTSTFNTWAITETYDPDGNQTYEDLNVEDTYVLRKAAITSNAGGTYANSQIKRLKDYWLDPIADWISLTSLGSFTWGNPGANFAGYRINRINEVVMNGDINVTSYSSGTDATIVTLPITLPKKITLIVPALIGSTNVMLHLEVQTSGAINPLGLTNGQNVTIFLDCVRFSLDWEGII